MTRKAAKIHMKVPRLRLRKLLNWILEYEATAHEMNSAWSLPLLFALEARGAALLRNTHDVVAYDLCRIASEYVF